MPGHLRVQVMWSCCGRTICLWSADTGAWLGKIDGRVGNREIEEDLAPAGRGSVNPVVTHPYDDHSPSGSFSDGHVRINSDKVRVLVPSTASNETTEESTRKDIFSVFRIQMLSPPLPQV